MFGKQEIPPTPFAETGQPIEKKISHLTPKEYSELPDGTPLFDTVKGVEFKKGEIDVEAEYGDRYEKYPVELRNSSAA